MIPSPECREALKRKIWDLFFSPLLGGLVALKLTVDIYASDLLFQRSRVDLTPATKKGQIKLQGEVIK